MLGEAQEPAPLPYLAEEPWAYDIALSVELNGTVIARTNARYLYWSIAQQIAHLTVNGASLRTGDLLATGTISGPEREERGSLIELSWNGEEPIELPDGSTRTFLEDGDEVVLRGDPLGEVRGRIEPRRSERQHRGGQTPGGGESCPFSAPITLPPRAAPPFARLTHAPPTSSRCVAPRAPGEYAPAAGGRASRRSGCAALRGARVLHVSVAGAEGRVPELLGGLLPLAAGAGVEVEWRVLFGRPSCATAGAPVGLRGGESGIEEAAWGYLEACEQTARSLVTATTRSCCTTPPRPARLRPALAASASAGAGPPAGRGPAVLAPA